MHTMCEAVLAADADDVVDALARAEAVKQVMHMPNFKQLVRPASACETS